MHTHSRLTNQKMTAPRQLSSIVSRMYARNGKHIEIIFLYLEKCQIGYIYLYGHSVHMKMIANYYTVYVDNTDNKWNSITNIHLILY